MGGDVSRRLVMMAARCVVAAVVLTLASTSARATLAKTTAVAVSAMPVPDGTANFSTFGLPMVNDLGNVAFNAVLSGPVFGEQGTFLRDGTTLLQVARTGQLAPDGNGMFLNFGAVDLNNANQLAIVAVLTGTSGGVLDNRGVFRSNGIVLEQVIREGQPAVGGNGKFGDVSARPSINNVGQIVFGASLTETANGTEDNHAIYLSDGPTITQIARDGQVPPEGIGFFRFLGMSPPLNDAGHVAFVGNFSPTPNGIDDDTAIFHSDGFTLEQVLLEGHVAPDGNGEFQDFSQLAMNESGQLMFQSNLRETSGGFDDDQGIYLKDGAQLVQIARRDQAAPDGTGDFRVFEQSKLNDSGQVAFWAVTSYSGNVVDDHGIYRSDGSTLERLVGAHEPAPDGNGVLSTIHQFAFNNAGHAAFTASLANTIGGSSEDHGIYFYDNTLGLIEVARAGDEFLGSTITDLNRELGTLGRGGPPVFFYFEPALNESGAPHVAYRFKLADGRSGIAVWSLVPEPGTTALLGGIVVTVGLLFARRVSTYTVRALSAIESAVEK